MSIKAKHMVPIPINDISNEIPLPVDVYVKLSEEKYVVIAKQGSTVGTERLGQYKNKKLEYLWTPFDSYHRVTRQCIAIAGIAVNKDKLSDGQKTVYVAIAANAVFKELEMLKGISRDTFDNVKQVSDATVTLVRQHTDLNAILDALDKCSDEIIKHSLAVSALSVLIANEMGWQNNPTLEKLSLGGLLHDLGKLALPEDIRTKPTAHMSLSEMQMYESHPYKGMQMLSSLGIVPDDIISIVYEHHENSIGQGFPRRLRDLKMHPMAKIVALADNFCNLTFSTLEKERKHTPQEAVAFIEKVMGQPYNKEAFRALKILVLKKGFSKAS